MYVYEELPIYEISKKNPKADDEVQLPNSAEIPVGIPVGIRNSCTRA
jgi:hypothetical protein